MGSLILAAILFWGILTLWMPERWALAAFQVSLFALAGVRVFRNPRVHPVSALLAGCAAWALLQLFAGWSVAPSPTLAAALDWFTNLLAFSLAFDLHREALPRERFLRGVLIFGIVIAIAGAITALAAPPGFVVGRFDTGTGLPTLGPFVYRNQFAAFVEVILPLAMVRAILDRRGAVAYTLITAALFGSVIVAGSRTGTILCAAEIILIPLIAFARGLISGRTMTRVLAGSLAAATALTFVAGWESIWNRLQEPNPYALRRELVESSLAMVRDRPLTGFGLGTWSAAYPAYALFDDGRFVNQAHNDWVQWAAEGGVPFFAMMAAVAAGSVRPAIRSIWGVGLLAVFLHALVDYPMQQRPALAAFFFALLGTMRGTLMQATLSASSATGGNPSASEPPPRSSLP
jgi:O-antigen ligase